MGTASAVPIRFWKIHRNIFKKLTHFKRIIERSPTDHHSPRTPQTTSIFQNTIMGGLGGDFHVSPRIVSLAGGADAIVSGMIGCMLSPIIAKRTPLRLIFLAKGMVDCLSIRRVSSCCPLRHGVLLDLGLESVARCEASVSTSSEFRVVGRPTGMYGPPPFCKRKMRMACWSARMYPAFVGVAISWPEWNALRPRPF
jgi:hypothetical protein